MPTVNEGSSAWLTVQFKDKNGALAAPTSVLYRVDCLTSRTAVQGMSQLPGPMSGTMEIPLGPGLTSIRNRNSEQEDKRVTVVASYGLDGDQVTSDYDYTVRNLKFYS